MEIPPEFDENTPEPFIRRQVNMKTKHYTVLGAQVLVLSKPLYFTGLVVYNLVTFQTYLYILVVLCWFRIVLFFLFFYFVNIFWQLADLIARTRRMLLLYLSRNKKIILTLTHCIVIGQNISIFGINTLKVRLIASILNNLFKGILYIFRSSSDKKSWELSVTMIIQINSWVLV